MNIAFFRFISKAVIDPGKVVTSYVDYLFQVDPCEVVRYVEHVEDNYEEILPYLKKIGFGTIASHTVHLPDLKK